MTVQELEQENAELKELLIRYRKELDHVRNLHSGAMYLVKIASGLQYTGGDMPLYQERMLEKIRELEQPSRSG